MFHVSLYGGVFKIAANQPFCIEYSVGWVHRHLIFGGITNQPFGIGKSHIRGSCSVTLKKLLKISLGTYKLEHYVKENL